MRDLVVKRGWIYLVSLSGYNWKWLIGLWLGLVGIYIYILWMWIWMLGLYGVGIFSLQGNC